MFMATNITLHGYSTNVSNKSVGSLEWYQWNQPGPFLVGRVHYTNAFYTDIVLKNPQKECWQTLLKPLLAKLVQSQDEIIGDIGIF